MSLEENEVNTSNNEIITLKSVSIKKVNELFNTYKNNSIITKLLYTYINEKLPNYINEYHKNNLNNNNNLNEEQVIFIQLFLNKHKFYYLEHINCFYFYDLKNYSIIKEDDIVYKILTYITQQNIHNDKHKLKEYIIKHIKTFTLYNSIPETNTIQYVIKFLYPTFFNSKEQVKYFLTIIGDNILKKNTNLIFIINKKAKDIINELLNISSNILNIHSITNNFISKYHTNYNYQNCRLIHMNELEYIDIWKKMFKKIALNFICVSTHYSNRYGNSDNFLQFKTDDYNKNYSFLLKNNTETDIINMFLNKYIDYTNNNDYFISWKDIMFLWKDFLYKNNYPYIIYLKTFKYHLNNLLFYDNNTDSYTGITSKFLPFVNNFLHFWEENINYNNNNDFCNDLEIDELILIYKTYNKKISSHNYYFNEKDILKIIKHYYPDITIIDDKYILNISYIYWDKNTDIDIVIQIYKINNNYIDKIISYDNLYNFYTYYYNKLDKYIVSKKYFENYLSYKYKNLITL